MIKNRSLLAHFQEISDVVKSRRFRRLSVEGFWIVTGQVMVVIGSLIGVRILTDLLAPEAFGELALGMTVATLVNQVVFGPLSGGITRYYAPAAEQGDVCGYLGAVRRLAFSASGVIVLMIAVAAVGLLISGQTRWLGIVIAALVFAALSGCNAILSGIQNAARQRSIVALHQGMDSWLRFLVAAGMLVWLGSTSTMAMLGYATAAVLVLGSQYLFFRNIATLYIPGGEGEKNWLRSILKFSWPFTSWGIFYWAQSASDRWALELFSTTRDVGLYSVLFQLGYYPMSIATGMAMQLLAPIFYQRAGDATDDGRNVEVNNLSFRLTWYALGMTVAVFLVGLLLHSQIYRIFVRQEYASVSRLLPWLLLAGGIFSTGQLLALNMMSQMKTSNMAFAKIITALLGVALNFAGAYLYGIAGIVFANVLFSVLYLLWMAKLSTNFQK